MLTIARLAASPRSSPLSSTSMASGVSTGSRKLSRFHGDAVTGIEHQRHVLSCHLRFEFLEQRRHLGVRDVRTQQHLELEGLQLRRNVGGVVLGVRQISDVLIGGIAEHQRDALAFLGL